jgi:hypothetical protein
MGAGETEREKDSGGGVNRFGVGDLRWHECQRGTQKCVRYVALVHQGPLQITIHGLE